MFVTALPMLVELPVGQSAQIAVTITNTTSVIDAYTVRAFGLDPQWLIVDPARLSLFPAEVGLVEITVTLPSDFPAGLRTIAVHVQSENDPTEFTLAQISLDVGTRSRTSLRVDPVTITGGSSAQFALVVANEGNATVQARPMGVDPEDVVDIGFEPAVVVLPPARREIIRADVRGGRPWFGQPKPRVISFSLGPDAPPAMATFVQRPRIGRWLISLLGLVTVAAIFALVLSTVADRLVDEAGVDDALIDQALTQPGAGGGEAVSVTPSVVGGKVVVASTGQGVAGVQADLYSSGNGVVPLATAATDASGTYAFGRLPAGRYRLRFTGAGFDEQWYQASQTFADATDIEVEAGATVALEDLEIGGRPGSVTGMVVVADPVGTIARLVVPGLADTETNALVAELTVSADGSFLFEDVPSPANYQLIVSKEGYATEVRDVVLGAAQDLEGIEVVLREGDGVVSGLVQSPSGPLGGVDVTATGGDTEVTTVTLTLDAVGTFAVRTLPTPGQYTLTFEREGYSSATRTVDLTAAQQVSGLAVTLSPTRGAISGTVSVGDLGPAGGVTVTVTGPDDIDQSTVTASVGAVGSYVFDSLPEPATYTITFSRPGLVSQTRLVDLDPLAGRGSVGGVDARMVSSTAIVRGIVRSSSGLPVAGASVELNDGSEVRDVLTADDPVGRFEFSAVEPGAYTLTARLPGTSPAVLLVNVIAADVVDLPVTLEPQASLVGRVLVLDPATGQPVPFGPCPVPPVAGPPCGAVVRLFEAADFPGLPSQAVATTATDANGGYAFPGLTAPDDFVVSVYFGQAADALDSVLVQTQPSQAVEVPTFQIRQAP
jgi:hypothetical protein